MPDEYDPMREMGFVDDRELVLEPQGILTPANTTRDLCEHFIPNGGKIFDLIERYDMITTLVLNNNGTDNGTLSYLAPILKAFGATDYAVSRFFTDNIPLTDHAADTMRYLLDIMPVFMDSMVYEHAADAICEKTGVPLDVTGSCALTLDDFHMPVNEAREIRKIAADIAKLRLPSDLYDEDSPLELDADEVRLVNVLDDVFQNRLRSGSAFEMMQETSSVGLSEKAYALLDIRKSTQIDLDGVMYAGSESSDYQVLDLVREGGGLALSFNGTEAAVHGSDVAVISDDTTVLTFLGSVFFDTGVQGVIDLAAQWSRKYLENTEFPDQNLADEILRMYPRKLPEVYRIDDGNKDQISTRSEAFRNKLMKRAKLRAAKTA